MGKKNKIDNSVKTDCAQHPTGLLSPGNLNPFSSEKNWSQADRSGEVGQKAKNRAMNSVALVLKKTLLIHSAPTSPF